MVGLPQLDNARSLICLHIQSARFPISVEEAVWSYVQQHNYGAQDGFDSLRDLIFFEDEILIE